MKQRFKVLLVGAVDLVSLPLTYLSGLWLSSVRRWLHRLPLTRKLLRTIGVLPVRHHYYEPVVFPGDLRRPLTTERPLPGLDLNVEEQLELLEKFHFNLELANLPLEESVTGSFYYHNKFFESGDAEFLFNMIRHFKPANIIEVGGGYSTLMTRYAIKRNIEDHDTYSCNHICVEPYEQAWLERSGPKVIRKRVELLDPGFFGVLGKNDFLVIDSSHVVRPQGDVLFEYLELLGTLKSGVIIHAHDIFTPRDYPQQWVIDESKLWTEQYLLEAFLSYNPGFRVIGALNYLWHNYRQHLTRVCPILAQEPNREPASFWFVRN